MHGRPRLSRERLRDRLGSLPLPVVGVLLAVLVAAVAVPVALLLSRPLQVRTPPSASDPACARLARALPQRLGSLDRRPTSSSSPAVAAWGDPAVVWLCGVREPAVAQTCVEANGEDWVAVELGGDGLAFTTDGRSPAVQVLVPHAYAPEALRLPALSTVVATLPQGRKRCSA